MRKLLLGLDIGSSSVKASLLDADSGKAVVSKAFPEVEMPIASPEKGWAEQDPEMWWKYVRQASNYVLDKAEVKSGELKGIGIAYQMHGLVLVDKDQNVLRSSIIWCDSRAVGIGEKAFKELGEDYCLNNLLNSPGNFTASKLRWVIENEPEVAAKIHKMMLPGDFIAMKLTGEILTSETGLSEGIFWDFQKNGLSEEVLKNYKIQKSWIPELVSSYSIQGKVTEEASKLTGIEAGVPVSYRAGDQPNNAFSLQVLKPGELATTAGTSGTVYGVCDTPLHDPLSRVNTFVHVNHSKEKPSYGVLLCVNGTGILNSWLKRVMGASKIDYDEMNNLASYAGIGAEGLVFIPFGNGAERIMQNKPVGAHLLGLDLLKHDKGHVIRAAQEGIVSALTFGFRIMKDMGLDLQTVKAGKANMFLSPIFRKTFVHMNKVVLELYDTDGAQGAARGAGIGAGVFSTEQEAFEGLTLLESIEPNENFYEPYEEVYSHWKNHLESIVKMNL
ncbi:FGGY family carbohydrate kinase [Algoriphagus sp. CAU 1675]|uniref:xylulokinase n=1 Tax=Algoriphagus sp. CAU 1675 TaxID=3032597 RepID=UPI0023DBD43D|nr:FGGY family carbohydrate kinase [Algoriphagus sp. CAU 1675]MDF2157668.1 FGGY family carbohydrate kinase [Algoriphagus sp. CAU 1675]